MPLFESKFGGLQVTIQRPDKNTNSTSNSTSKQVLRLLNILTEDMSIQRMMKVLKLSSRPMFISNYLNPATSAGLVEMTQPDSPKSPTQKYRLTIRGKMVLESNTN